jgi:integrase
MAGSPIVHHLLDEPYPTLPVLPILIKMKSKGGSDYTIETTAKALRKLCKNADLQKPEQVELYIANLTTTDGYKRILCSAYKRYTDYYHIEWDKPRYQTQAQNFKVPTKQKIQSIIAGAGWKLALKLKISFECGLRPIELVNLTPNSIDLTNKTITPVTAKRGLARTLPISQNLCNDLQEYLNRHPIKDKEKLFPITPRTYSKLYRLARNKVAKKLGDPSIKQIRLYDFRHYFGTATYDKTKDLGFTATLLGHRNWKNTQVYVQILAVLNGTDQEYTAKVAKTPQEVMELIEQGFQFVLEMEGLRYFKKRK